MLKANISFAATVVVVKSDVVELMMAVPVAKDTPLVLIRLDTVGAAVPDAIFQTFTVAVPASATMLHPVIVPATGKTTYEPC